MLKNIENKTKKENNCCLFDIIYKTKNKRVVISKIAKYLGLNFESIFLNEKSTKDSAKY